jgi:ABC-type lipoprotein release transport system permease subunit
VFGSAIIGIIAGMLGIEWLNSADIHVNNQYISILFGGEAVRGRVTLSSIAVHLAAAFVFTILSMLYPLKKALGIQPVEAMAE